MMQVPTVNQPAYATASQPNYNAVKIDIHNPQVNAGGYSQAPAYAPASAPLTAPMYAYPQAQIYELPQQSVYQPQQNFKQPLAVQEAPQVPQPVVIPAPIIQAPVVPAPAPAPVAAAPVVQAPVVEAPVVQAPAVQPVVVTPPVATTIQPPTSAPVIAAVQPVAAAAPAVTAQAVDVKSPEVVAPKLDLNAFIGKLTSPDFQQQEIGMEAIAELAKNAPAQATELLDVKVVDSLLGIMEKDTSKLEGPTSQQLQIREKIMAKQPVTDAEMAEASKITPMELGERNKQYAIYTVAILQKLYGTEVQKLSNEVVPLTNLPGIAGEVEQLKNNPNPMVRAAVVDGLSHIKRPEYKNELTALFTVAKNDKDPIVSELAAKNLEDLSKLA